jgi:hypothetical protein
MAGLEDLHSLSLFATPARPGFNGRQALVKENNDVFYSAMKSVTSLATALVKEYDRPGRQPGSLPIAGAVAFPLVVIEGRLFEAWFDEGSRQMRLEERQQLRLHWRGAPSWSWHATVDVIVADHLEAFAQQRAAEVDCLLSHVSQTTGRIARCFESRSLKHLQPAHGPRGIVGLPPLLAEINQLPKKRPRGQKGSNSRTDGRGADRRRGD